MYNRLEKSVWKHLGVSLYNYRAAIFFCEFSFINNNIPLQKKIKSQRFFFKHFRAEKFLQAHPRNFIPGNAGYLFKAGVGAYNPLFTVSNSDPVNCKFNEIAVPCFALPDGFLEINTVCNVKCYSII